MTLEIIFNISEFSEKILKIDKRKSKKFKQRVNRINVKKYIKTKNFKNRINLSENRTK